MNQRPEPVKVSDSPEFWEYVQPDSVTGKPYCTSLATTKDYAYHGDITVYAPTTRFGAFSQAEINWSAWGSQPIEKTEGFAAMLNYAIELAKEYNTQAGIK